MVHLRTRAALAGQRAPTLTHPWRTDAHACHVKALDALGFVLESIRLPAPEREYRFAPPRMWRFDYAWPDRRLALEIEGGTWTRGRHVRGKGYERDCEKYNAAALAGWMVLRHLGHAQRRPSVDALATGVSSQRGLNLVQTHSVQTLMSSCNRRFVSAWAEPASDAP